MELTEVILPNGTKHYRKNGALHNEDGPAVIDTDGSVLWCLCGFGFSFDVWCDEAKKTPEEIVFLKLKYGIHP